MTLLRPKTSRIRMLALLTLAGAMLSACSPTPEPTPTPTVLFESEEEAFAAAEETYRAYNDAGNARRNGEPTPNPQDYLIGVALEGDIEALSELRDANVHLEGTVDVTSFRGISVDFDSQPARIVAFVCLDTSGTQVIDGADEVVTPAAHDSKVSQQVTFVVIGSDLRISIEDLAKDDEC